MPVTAARATIAVAFGANGRGKEGFFGLSVNGRSQNAVERLGEERVLFGGADGYADRLRAAEAVRWPHDHAFSKESLEQRPRILADLAVEEVRDRGPCGGQAV